MAPVALAFGVLPATGSAGWLSLVTASALIPMVAMLLVGGGIADPYRRDTILWLTSVCARRHRDPAHHRRGDHCDTAGHRGFPHAEFSELIGPTGQTVWQLAYRALAQ